MDAPENRSKALNEHPRADFIAACRHVRFVPNASLRTARKTAKSERASAKVINLMDALRRSVDAEAW
jgi:hypothetical protein